MNLKGNKRCFFKVKRPFTSSVIWILFELTLKSNLQAFSSLTSMLDAIFSNKSCFSCCFKLRRFSTCRAGNQQPHLPEIFWLLSGSVMCRSVDLIQQLRASLRREPRRPAVFAVLFQLGSIFLGNVVCSACVGSIYHYFPTMCRCSSLVDLKLIKNHNQ